MTKTLEKKIINKFSEFDEFKTEFKALKRYIFSIYPAEEKEIIQAYQEIISGKTASINNLIADLKKDKNACKT